MSESVVEASVRAVFPTSAGCAVFIGNDEKTFVIYVDQSVGAAITMALRKTPPERPQTHDLIADMFTALGVEVSRIVVNDFQDGVYYARLIFEVTNEVQETKIFELDARPSDSIAIAVRAGAPIYIARHVWDDADDMSDVLQTMEGPEFDVSENDD